MKKVRKTNTSRKNKHAPHTIKHRGHSYERLSKTSKEVEFDLASDVLHKIDMLVTEGKYVSRGDAIRDILRRVIESTTPIE